jgi:hypothetical protein
MNNHHKYKKKRKILRMKNNMKNNQIKKKYNIKSYHITLKINIIKVKKINLMIMSKNKSKTN